MAFGEAYGYKTNSRFVAAVAESDERNVDNPAYNGTADTDNPGFDTEGNPESVQVVDLVLHGFANGRRNNVLVSDETAWDDIRVNTCVPGDVAGAALAGAAPGETTGGFPDATYSGGSSDQAGGSTQGAIA